MYPHSATEPYFLLQFPHAAQYSQYSAMIFTLMQECADLQMVIYGTG